MNKGGQSDPESESGINSDNIVCEKNENGHLKCKCKEGFVGDFCQKEDDSECTDAELCNFNGKPWKKGKKCVCDCYPDFLGAFCEKKRNDIFKVDCGSGIEVCCKNGKLCGDKDLANNMDCHSKCFDALYNPELKLPKNDCMCGE
tara:strand:+ start:5325 stop:5759 length:435 start_codon:yes stop_codon:yes gene_type:complete